jgi:hypothetical protein
MIVLPLGGNSAACWPPSDHKFVLPKQNVRRNLLVPQKSPDIDVQKNVLKRPGWVQYFR